MQAEHSRSSSIALHSCWATVLYAVDKRYDVRGSILSLLVRLCLENRARVPKAQRIHYAQYVQQEALEFLEDFTADLLFGRSGRFSPHEYRYTTIAKLRRQ
ncbi:UNVERIFIED_CONTAM: hypothetical protein P3D59_22460 [Pseudomonas aeruginosa]|nr:hypothetical protein [Pseudomonas aeruginosa]